MYKYPKGGYLLKPQFSTLPMQMAGVRDNTTIMGNFILIPAPGYAY
jgi:hypothetical protein